MEILYKSKNAVVISKPYGISTQADMTGDSDAMSLTSAQLREQGERDGLWLVHRLDRVVGGLLLFARNKSSAAQLSESIRERDFCKEYLAVVEGRAEGGELIDYLYRDARMKKAFVTDKGRRDAREARLTYEPLANVKEGAEEYTLVKIKLHTGRFHQIRAQFSSHGMALVGDTKYGSRKKCSGIALFACRLEAALKGEKIAVSEKPPINAYPWNLFEEEVYDEKALL